MKMICWANLLIFTAILLFLVTDCKKDESAGKVPSCATHAATNVLTKCATLNGTLTTSFYSAYATFEYGTSTSYGSFTETFPWAKEITKNVSADISGLTPGITYHFRIKAANSYGAVFGDDMSFSTLSAPADHTGETGTVKDAEGNDYHTIGIGSQIWMAENLKTTRYSNGDLIGTTTPASSDISGESTPKYQWAYDGDESNVTIYGRLYSWYAVTDNRNVCPAGWHVPTDREWTILTDYLLNNCYGYTRGGRTGIARSMADTNWDLAYCVCPGNNSSGFTALPGGYRENTTSKFYHIDYDCSWWCSTEFSTADAYYRSMTSESYSVYSNHDNKQLGFSVRCLQD